MDTITVTTNNRQYTLPQAIKLEAVLAELDCLPDKPVAALVNNQLQELDYALFANSSIVWLGPHTELGKRIYKRTMHFILKVICQKLLPCHQLKIFHALDNGTYCELSGAALPADAYGQIAAAINQMLAQDLPITKSLATLGDMANYFAEQGNLKKAQTLAEIELDSPSALYTLDGATDYFFGPLATHTGLLDAVTITSFDNGFILRMPGIKNGQAVAKPFQEPKRLQAIIRGYKDWGHTLGIETIADVNQFIKQDRLDDLILIAESMHQRKMLHIADSIVADFPQVKVVLIAGPSSSGKTTFTHRLAIELFALGIKPFTISMDNYFLDRADTPKDASGEYDFESIYAMDLNLFNDHLKRLVQGERINIPIYDFKSGTRSEATTPCELGPDNLVLIEGIHGLNPLLSEALAADYKRQIYISCLTQLAIDDFNPISSSDNREIRRMVRDMRTRGSSPEATILRWPSVRRGEERNIFPYQENADYYFNSSLIYELSALAPIVSPELAAISKESAAYPEAQRLLEFLDYFLAAEHTEHIPIQSLAREFLGGGIFPV